MAAEPRLAIVMGTEGDGLPYKTIAEADYVVRILWHMEWIRSMWLQQLLLPFGNSGLQTIEKI